MYLLLNFVTFVLFGRVPAVLLCVLAACRDLWNVWATAGIFVVWLTFQSLVAYRQTPELLKERMKPGEGGRVRWTTARAYLVLTMLQWSIRAGLDQRFHWSDIFPLARIGALYHRLGVGNLVSAGEPLLFARSSHSRRTRAAGDPRRAVCLRATSRLRQQRPVVCPERPGAQFAALDCSSSHWRSI